MEIQFQVPTTSISSNAPNSIPKHLPISTKFIPSFRSLPDFGGVGNKDSPKKQPPNELSKFVLTNGVNTDKPPTNHVPFSKLPTLGESKSEKKVHVRTNWAAKYLK